MGINKEQLSDLIKRVLTEAGLYSPSARELLLLTAAQESLGGTYLRQLGKGPALGIFQMEPATHDDIWSNFLAYREPLGERILEVAGMGNGPDEKALEYNIAYAILMARVHYLRVKSRLPDGDDIKRLAEYWKDYFNTPLGAGTVEEAIHNYKRYCEDV
ncbi:hypothetical protein [Maridesulfovibrio ferrireducens]|uniref:hypothetical protein n=1 Tax=Maridesulfovibrio ferrireducens TaxID=246191 RepID=UPI001A1B0ECE|nr:hypothetical protein [Maridesulfovibrio ferrireducens]MBI9110268.1 hypothetical protein [Maridesulfovibrio ferrireducens]